MEKSKCLLAFVNILWLIQSSLPVLDRQVPSLFSFPLSELLVFVLGIIIVLSTGCLMAFLSYDHDPRGTFIFIVYVILSCIWVGGVGMHTCANTIQKQLTKDHALYPMVHDDLHRLWSHNLLQCGYYGLLLLLVWVENPSKGKMNPATSTCRELILETVWSVILGLAYTLISLATHTVLVTFIFFVLVLALSGLSLSKTTFSVSVSCVTGLCLMFTLFFNNVLL